jgi:hypothetical protein
MYGLVISPCPSIFLPHPPGIQTKTRYLKAVAYTAKILNGVCTFLVKDTGSERNLRRKLILCTETASNNKKIIIKKQKITKPNKSWEGKRI